MKVMIDTYPTVDEKREELAQRIIFLKGGIENGKNNC